MAWFWLCLPPHTKLVRMWLKVWGEMDDLIPRMPYNFDNTATSPIIMATTTTTRRDVWKCVNIFVILFSGKTRRINNIHASDMHTSTYNYQKRENLSLSISLYHHWFSQPFFLLESNKACKQTTLPPSSCYKKSNIGIFFLFFFLGTWWL